MGVVDCIFFIVILVGLLAVATFVFGPWLLQEIAEKCHEWREVINELREG